jgi:hypothetical protein
MTWKADLGNAITGTNTCDSSAATELSAVVASNDTGKVFVDMEGTYKRQK